ncbi:MAG TPA: Ger(x)C family spore germination protein [Bacillus bacterium]|nr:Ger(x)C family spore germination protein [Bacillus sp. (in: firmicutes)]
MNVSRITFIILLFTIPVLLTGCWDRKEVNDLAIITAAGFDRKSKDKMELTVLVFIPKTAGGNQAMGGGGGSGGGKQVLIRSAEGVSVTDAFSNLQQKFPRLLFWGHTEVFIINEKFAEEDIRPHFDFILRHPQLRDRAHIFISKQKAKEVLTLSPPLERDLAEVLRELATLKIGMDVTIKEFAQMQIGHSKAAAVPFIEMLPPPEDRKPEETIAYITGTAILKRGKMVGFIDESVTRGVLWLRNEIKDAIVTVKPEGVEGYISMNLLRAKTMLKPTIENGKWMITLKAVTEDDIIKNGTKLNLSDENVIKMLEQKLKADIIQKAETTLDIVQKEMKTDVFGFAEAFHRAYPDIWKENKDNWEEIFPTVEVVVNADAYIRRPGMVTRPSLIPEDEVIED